MHCLIDALQTEIPFAFFNGALTPTSYTTVVLL